MKWDGKGNQEKGLLESNEFHLRRGAGEIIIAGAGGEQLGQIHISGRTLAFISMSKVYQVHEAGHSPLVFSVIAGFLGRRAEVRDAEDSRVGFLEGKRILDWWRRPVFYLDQKRFLGPNSEVVATLSPSGSTVSLRIEPILHGEPFAKMLLLAHVIAR